MNLVIRRYLWLLMGVSQGLSFDRHNETDHEWCLNTCVPMPSCYPLPIMCLVSIVHLKRAFALEDFFSIFNVQMFRNSYLHWRLGWLNSICSHYDRVTLPSKQLQTFWNKFEVLVKKNLNLCITSLLFKLTCYWLSLSGSLWLQLLNLFNLVMHKQNHC